MVLVYQYWSNKAGSLGHFFFFLSCMLLILKYVNLCAATFSVPCMYQFADLNGIVSTKSDLMSCLLQLFCHTGY